MRLATRRRIISGTRIPAPLGEFMTGYREKSRFLARLTRVAISNVDPCHHRFSKTNGTKRALEFANHLRTFGS